MKSLVVLVNIKFIRKSLLILIAYFVIIWCCNYGSIGKTAHVYNVMVISGGVAETL